MKIKKIFIILILIISSLSMISCFNYNDINRVTFVTGIIFDEDKNSNVVLYLDCVKAYRNANESADKGKRILYKGEGKTALEAIKDVNRVSSFNLNFSQNRAYIFTGNAVNSGIKKYIDLINNDPEFPITPNIFVYHGDINHLLDMSKSDEEYLGLFLDNLIEKNKNTPKVIQSNTNDYMAKRLMPNNIAMMTSIDLKEDVLDKKIQLNGGTVIQNDRMVGKIDNLNALSYNLLINNVRTGSLEIVNEETENDFITLNILKARTGTSVTYNDDKIILKKKIKLKTNIAESQSKLLINSELLDKLKRLEEESIKLHTKQVFEEYKEKNIDILEVLNLLNKKYGYEEEPDYLSKVELEVDVDLQIDGTGRVKNTL
ncbi:hypothetical protein UT300005_12520 [Clostridium sp. CTA-5]